MSEQDYYVEIESYIKKNELNKKKRILEENYHVLNNYWHIGKLLVELQNGKRRANYGDELIKKWSIEFTKNYGKGYDATALRKYRQYYSLFTKCATMSSVLTWSHIVEILPIKDENKRNYYLNKVINNNLSVRRLREEIKSNSYERLINKPKHIELIVPEEKYTIINEMKNPIIIKVDKNKSIKNEKDLELIILSEIAFILNQLGTGYAFIDSQYKINNYFIDILLFNIKLNCYVVVELKLRKLKAEDKAQTEIYMKLVDDNLKEIHHSKTIGIIITKEQDKYIANFVRSENIIPLTYELQEIK